LFEVPSNMLLQRFGANRWVARIMISWGVLSAGFAFVGTARMFYVLRFLLGVAEAGFYPGIIFYLSNWVPSIYRGRAIAMMMSAIPLSSIVGNPLSGWIMDNMRGVLRLGGWQWMLILEAIPAVLMGVAVLCYLDNSIGAAKWLNQAEKGALQREIDRERNTQLHGVLDAASAFKDVRIWTMSLIYFCVVLGQYGLTFWMPTLIKSAGVTGNLKTGAMSAIPYVVTLVAMNLLGRSADRRRERRWHLIAPALVGALGFALVPTAPSAGVAIAVLSLAAGGAISCSALFWSLPTAILSGAAAAAGIAMINSLGNLAGFAAPYMIGVVIDKTGSSGIGMYVIAGALIVGAFFVWLTPARMVNR
jgi:MFS family permease